METLFKIVFTLAILVFCLIIVGAFVLILKIILLFNPDISLWGLLITRA